MYYVISQSTDLRSPNTVVKKFTSIIAAKKWAKIDNGKYTYSDPEAVKKLASYIQRGLSFER